MNRYLRAFGCVILGSFKYIVLKIERGNNIKMGFPMIISKRTEITVDSGGEMVVGKGMSLRSGCRLNVRKAGKLVVGSHLYMNTGCQITVHDRITIGDNVEFGPNVLIYDQDHDFTVEGGLAANKFKTTPVTIGNNVWIGANSVILRGTDIGDNCVIGAGSVIKGTYPPGTIILQKRQEILRKIYEK